MLAPLDAAQAVLCLCRLLWLRRARDEERGVLLQGSPHPLREAASRLAVAVADAEAHAEGSAERAEALTRAATEIERVSQLLIPTDGLVGMIDLGAQLVRGTRHRAPTPPRRWGQ